MRLIGNVEKDAQVRAVASGALPSGDAVVVNVDGTVSVVAGTDASAGTPVVYVSNEVIYVSSTFDSSSNKVVVAYRNSTLSDNGYAVVGTVSGTSISFGTPVAYNTGGSSTNFNAITFDSNSNKVVIAYQDGNNSNLPTAIVGTVSGTSISFGTEVVISGSNNSDFFAITFDSSSNKVVVAYRNQDVSSEGTAVVGTVSGTSISFGTPVVFDASPQADQIAATFDSNSNKVVIAYRDSSNSNYGTAVVGTVSGTSISFGTPVVFESANADQTSCAFDSNNNKVIISYRDFANSGHGTAVVGTVSGTSISFGTPVVFETSDTLYTATSFDSAAGGVVISYRSDPFAGKSVFGTVSGTSISFQTAVTFETGRADYISSAFDSANNKVVIVYQDNGNSSYGTSAVYSPPSTNLTTENFLGFADSGYADGQSAAINSTCTVDRNQTSLTAGQTYYVQTDGSLGTTAGDPSVVAGTAISSTEIIVKG